MNNIASRLHSTWELEDDIEIEWHTKKSDKSNNKSKRLHLPRKSRR